jgi:hypothetical protein
MERKFYVCSFGGSGSKMLCTYLNNFGSVYHIHSRKPPQKLTATSPNLEWFNDRILSVEENKKTTVIFIYRNPVDAILSRFYNPRHLHNIQTDATTTVDDVCETQKDLYGLYEFFDNYTKSVDNNYDIYCIKYEDLFNNIKELDKSLKLESHEDFHPIKKESKYKWGSSINKRYDLVEPLTEVYKDLIKEMDNMPFIKINT